MGFGILFVSYYLTYLVGMVWKNEGDVFPIGASIILLGCLLITYALLHLAEYEKAFRSAMIANLFVILTAVYRVLYRISENFLWDLPLFSESARTAVEYLEFLFVLIFSALLLLAVRKLASDVDEPKTYAAATRNMVFLLLYALCQIMAHLPVGFAKYFTLSAVVIQVIYHILVGVMLIGCYMRICDESDRDMPLHKSRFAWVNRIREERARREQQAADRVTEYAEKRLRKKQQARENAKKGHRGGKKR